MLKPYSYWILLLALPASIYSQSDIQISFSRIPLPDTATFPAAAKMTFRPAGATFLKHPELWRTVEEAPLLDNPAFQRIFLIRYEGSNHQVGYAIDSNGTVGETDDKSIVFHEYPSRKVADVDIPVKRLKPDPGKLYHLGYQIILDSEGVTARPAECREGKGVFGDRTFPVRLVLTSVNSPFYSLTGGSACFADTDGSGSYAATWTLSSTGKLIPSERIPFTTPTRINGMKIRVSAVDSSGESLTFTPYPGDTALAIGYFSPDWKVIDMAGVQRSLASSHGKVTVLLFWSTSCPYCEKIRPMLNGMVGDNDSSSFQVIACCLEKDSAQIRSFLAIEPYSGIIVPYDSTFWQEFNHRMSTPAECVIDKDGTIRFAGSGVSMFEIAQRVAQNLLTPH